MLIDTHCHLYNDPLVSDVPGVLSRARMAGVEAIVVPGVDLNSSCWARDRAVQDPDLLAAAGFHPDALPDGFDPAGLTDLVRSGGIWAIGEIGLDTTTGQNLGRQEEAFRFQMRLAQDHGLPALIHCRGPFGRLLEILKELGSQGPGGILHAYNGSWEIAAELLRLGYSFGVCGVVTKPGATRVRAVVERLPLERLVLETDAPFIGTLHSPKGRVEPQDLVEIGQALAELRGLSFDEVARSTTQNARGLFRKVPP